MGTGLPERSDPKGRARLNISLSAEPIRLVLFLCGIMAFVGLNAAYLVWEIGRAHV